MRINLLNQSYPKTVLLQEEEIDFLEERQDCDPEEDDEFWLLDHEFDEVEHEK